MRGRLRRDGAMLRQVATGDADLPSLSYGHLVGDSMDPAMRADLRSLGAQLDAAHQRRSASSSASTEQAPTLEGEVVPGLVEL